MGNTFGKLFRVTTYGESHGASLGGIIDGCPAGLELNLDGVQAELDRRKPGQSKLTTTRKEADVVHFESGIFEGVTTGAPIGFRIENTNQRSKDYSHLSKVYRPAHADYTYEKKYGLRDYRGGGRSSARETVCRVVAGAIAKQILHRSGIRIHAYVSQVGNLKMENPFTVLDFSQVEKNLVRCADPEMALKMQDEIEQARKEKDSLGGVVSCQALGVPAGWGEPVFDKLNASLGAAMLGINAVKGFEIGSGFQAARMRGSEHNDAIISSNEGGIQTESNHAGGILGGISNGAPICMNVAFKPVATIGKEQQTINVKGEAETLAAKGRHDPCVVPRAVPIVEAMAALVLVDAFFMSRLNRFD